ncbi:MAG: hypothetical protein EXR62_18500 [Chloroflexi bacterium]|nr:hypothetical protein [Chloroflexota bacterium]
MKNRTGSTAQRLKEMPYEKRVCRLERYPPCLPTIHAEAQGTYDEAALGVSIEEEVAAMADAGVEVWIIDGTRGRGAPLFPSKMLPPVPDIDYSLIPRFLDLAHQRGILVLTYYPFIFTKPLVNLHPEWMIQMLDDGQPPIWNEGWFCWNSPYRDWLADYLIEELDYLDFDGFYFDDMNWGSHSDTGQRRTPGCCCPYCQDLYQRETGRALPTKVDLTAPDFKQYVNWRYGKFQEQFSIVVRRIREKYPDIVVDFNYYARAYGAPDVGWQTAHPLNPVHTDTHLFVETGLGNMSLSVPAKLCAAHGKGFGMLQFHTQALPECAAHNPPYPEPYSAAVCGLTAVAHGGGYINVSLQNTGQGEHIFYQDTLKTVYGELKKLRAYAWSDNLVPCDTVKYVALHVSQQTRDFGYHQAPDDFWKNLKGSHEMLRQSHLFTDYLYDDHITDARLSRYQVLFLSNNKCLSAGQAEAMRGFVARGGVLIATHETSLYDELGNRRDNFLLADVLGVDYQPPPQPPSAPNLDEQDELYQKAWYGQVMDYRESNIYVPQSDALRQTVGDLLCFGAPQSTVSLRPEGAQVQALCTKSTLSGGLKIPGRRPPLNYFDPDSEYDAGLPAVTVSTYGKGRAYYICGDVGAAFERNPLPQLKRFVAYLVGSAPPPIEVVAPKCIETHAWMRDEHTLIVYLLNNPAPFLPWDMPRWQRHLYFFIEELTPVHDVAVHLHHLAGRPVAVRRASLPWQNRTLDVTANPATGGATLIVPKVGLHEVLVVEI